MDQQQMTAAPPLPTGVDNAAPAPANNSPYNDSSSNNNRRSMGGRGARPPKQPSRGRGEMGGGRTSPRNGRGGRGHSGRAGRGGPGRAGGNGRGSNVNKIAPTTGVPFGHVPAYLPGSSSLVEELDKRIMIVLRDGRHLVGVSASVFQCIKCNLYWIHDRQTQTTSTVLKAGRNIIHVIYCFEKEKKDRNASNNLPIASSTIIYQSRVAYTFVFR